VLDYVDIVSTPHVPASVPVTPRSVDVVSPPQERRKEKKRNRNEEDVTVDLDLEVSFFELASKGEGELVVAFSGVSRGSKEDREAACSAILFLLDGEGAVQAYDSTAKRIGSKTSIQAEIMGITLAEQLLQQCHKKTGRCLYKIVGSSTHAISGIQDGKIFNLTPTRSDQPNWDSWNEVKSAMSMRNPAIVATFAWIPMDLNGSAHAIANGVLDGKDDFQGFIMRHAPQCSTSARVSEMAIDNFWSGNRRAACKYLVPHVQAVWHKLFYGLLAMAITKAESPDAFQYWAAVMLAPIVFLFPQRKADQKIFLSQNADPRVAFATFQTAVLTPTYRDDRVRREMSLEERVVQLVRDDKTSRACEILEGSKVSIQTPTNDDIEKYWPTKDDELKSFDRPHVDRVAFSQIEAAARGLGKGRAADLGGWTKETFMPLIYDAEDFEKRSLEELFTRLINGRMPPCIMEMIKTDAGLFIGTEQKKRPIVIGSIFSKIMWRIAFHRTQEHFPAQQILATTATLQLMLTNGNHLLRLDGSNAFFNARRSSVFDAIKEVTCPYFRACWNLFYAEQSKIAVFAQGAGAIRNVRLTTGVKAGCVSASKLFNKLMTTFIAGKAVLSIVDDVYVVLRPGAYDIDQLKQCVAAESAFTGVDFLGRKTLLITKETPPLVLLGAVIAPDPRMPLDSVFDSKHKPVEHILAKLVDLRVPLQVKFHIVRVLFLRMKYLYRATHLPQAQPFAEMFDAMFCSFFRSIFDLREMPRLHDALIQLPVEQGGLGFANLQHMWELYWNKQVSEVSSFQPLLRGFAGIDAVELPSFIDGTLPCESESTVVVQQIKKKFDDEPFVRSVLNLKTTRQSHLLNAVPAESMALQDDVFRALLYTKLQYAPSSVEVHCDTTDARSLFHHFHACSKCRQGTVRHNKVLYELSLCLPKIGFVTTTNPRDLPLPKKAGVQPAYNESALWAENTVCGPDMKVYANPPHCIDLVVAAPLSCVEWNGPQVVCQRDAMLMAHTKKIATYREWQEVYQMQCHPIVMSVNGLFHPATVSRITEYAKGRGQWIVPWIELRMQRALAEAMSAIFNMGTHRAKAAAFLSSVVNARKSGVGRPTHDTVE
jgi:hypothetical protein